jgi:hypothetical protein
MRFQKQSIMGYNPEAGIYGDCYRTCIASLLDMDLHDVPHFVRDSELAGKDGWHTHAKTCEWLRERGMTMLTTTFTAGSGVVDVMRYATNGMPFMLTIKSSAFDCCHSVIAKVGDYGLECLWCPTEGKPVRMHPFFCKDNQCDVFTVDVIVAIPESIK